MTIVHVFPGRQQGEWGFFMKKRRLDSVKMSEYETDLSFRKERKASISACRFVDDPSASESLNKEDCLHALISLN